jgi:mannose-6-phosphate isomerase-like protein (cupin superfamily)
MHIGLTAALVAALAIPALAQSAGAAAVRETPADKFIFLSQQTLAQRLAKPGPGRSFGAVIVNDHENYFVEFVRRQDHGNQVEQHDHWVDQITILSGHGTLTRGGTLSGGKETGPGEVRGGTQQGATVQPLHPGDFVLIPAGMPHKFDAAPGTDMVYSVFKARQ